MKSCYKNISKIRNITFIIQNFERKMKNVEKDWTNTWILENQSIYLKWNKDRLPYNLLDNIFFIDFLITFRHYYYEK